MVNIENINYENILAEMSEEYDKWQYLFGQAEQEGDMDPVSPDSMLVGYAILIGAAKITAAIRELVR